MSLGYVLAAALVMGLVTLFCRAAPFLFFRSRKPPAVLDYLQRYMPPMIMTILVLNGPNLNMLGVREPGLYGTTTLAEIEQRTRQLAESLGLACEFRQTNHEGVMVDWSPRSSKRFNRSVRAPFTRRRARAPALRAGRSM